MKRLFTLILAALAAALPAALAAPVGQWTYYLAYHDASQNVPAGDVVYALFNGNLLAYSPADTEVRTITKMDGLSEKNISRMAYCQPLGCLVLVYPDCNIDLLYADGSVVNLPQLKNSNEGDMEPEGLCVTGTEAVLATGDGLAHLDLERQEVSGYYRPDDDVTAAAVLEGRLFAATAQGIASCAVADNPADRNNWTLTQVLGAAADAFHAFAGGLYFTVPSSADAGLWRLELTAGGQPEARRIDTRVYTQGYADSRVALFRNADRVAVFEPTAPDAAATTWQPVTSWTWLTRATDGTYWACEGADGLRPYRLADGQPAATGEAIGGYGPRRDLCYYMKFYGERLLIAGGRLDPSDRLHQPATLMAYENGRWTTFQEEGVQEETGLRFRDMTCIVQDPADPLHHFATAGGSGLYEYRNYEFVHNYNSRNSPLFTAALNGVDPNYVRLDGLNYDAEGNLWMVNNSADSVIRVLKTDGTWQSLYAEGISRAPTCEKALFDRAGRFWVASRRTVDNPPHTAGLLCLDNNGTLTDTDDDVATYRTNAYNEDGTVCDFGGVYALTLDTDGSIWMGTATGLYVVNDPDEWSSPSFRITQIKVPRNDGTNNADYLLAGVAVTDIAVDGAGRKWIGTESNGLYLVSADGTEILQHFEAASTPLLSDSIYSIAPNLATGEVMIGTSQGLCSYQSEATTPSDALQRSQVTVYPNPVRPEYSGNITVRGLTADADVKVTDTTGNVVAAGTSVGGTFIWDGRARGGGRAASGVYYIMVSTSDGKKGIAAKIVVI